MKKEFFLLSFLIFSGLSIFFFFSLENENNEVKNITQEKQNLLTNEDFLENQNLSFDIIRITKGGDAVMAGRALPGGKIQLFDGDLKIADISSDANGEWVWSSEIPLKFGTRTFSLKYIDKYGKQITSNDSITVYLDEKKSTQPLVLKSSKDGNINSEVLNLDSLEQGITLDVVEFSPQKKLMLSGRSAYNEKISIFSNNVLLGFSRSNVNGIWKFESQERINFDQLNLIIKTKQKGKDIELKTQVFSELILNVKEKLQIKSVIVKPGNSLWRIARKTLGGGILYTEIYKKNIEKIKNPNLIYPGQVFGIPIITTRIHNEK